MQGVTRFRAKISDSNEASLSLFAKLGYTHKNRSTVFKEITLELGEGGEGWRSVLDHAATLHLGSYADDTAAAV